jgi:hypothetical protein
VVGDGPLSSLFSEAGPSNLVFSPTAASWLQKGNRLEWVCTGDSGGVHWCELEFVATGFRPVANGASPARDVVATALARPRLAAVVTKTHLHWASVGPRIVWANPIPLQTADAFACFSSPLTNEVLVLSRDGWLERIPVPVSV